jgi:hypothetical protein
LKSKFPLKSTGHIKELVKQKYDNYLIEEEWKGIIYFIYDQEDAQFLENKILEIIKKKQVDSKLNEQARYVINIKFNRKLTRDEITNLSKMKIEYNIAYNDFQKVTK